MDESLGAALEAAAARQRKAVTSRKEGLPTKVLEGLGDIPLNMVGSFKNMMDAAYSHQPGTSIQDDPQYAGLVTENALNLIGVPALTGGVPASALGSAARRGAGGMIENQEVLKQLALDKRNAGRGSTQTVYPTTKAMMEAQGGPSPFADVMAGWRSQKGDALEEYRRAAFPERYADEAPSLLQQGEAAAQRDLDVIPFSNFTDKKTAAGALAVNNLPTDEASRLARAAEMGLGTDAFHGTVHDFPGFRNNPDNYMIDRALGSHLAKDPRISNSFVGINKLHEGGRVIPARIPDESKFLDVPQPLASWADPANPKWKQVATDQYAIQKMAAKEVLRRDPEMLARYIKEDRGFPADAATIAANDLLAGKSASFSGREYTLDKFIDNFGGKPHNEADRQRMVDLARQGWQDQGYEGLRYINTAPMEMQTAKDPTSYIVFDPARIRSRFAEFDPAKASSTDLLASNLTDKKTALGALLATSSDDRRRTK